MRLRWALALLAIDCATPAAAGPPYLTDDPAPTDTHHWEIYAFGAGEKIGRPVDANAGLDLNYGAVKDVQLTATLPLSFARDDSADWHEGAGDVELGVKYRLLNDEARGLSAAIFPRVILPTSGIEDGGRARLLLPLWLQKNFEGGTSLFGGGGYEVNPGNGNRDFWQAGAALTHDFTDTFSAGAEVTWQGADAIDSTGQVRAGIGSIVKLTEHHALLMSFGPTWADHRTGYHAYAAFGLFF